MTIGGAVVAVLQFPKYDTLHNDPPEVCVEDEYYNSGKWVLGTFLLSVLIRHPSVREIQESGY